MTLLSILIPCTHDRQEMLYDLLGELHEQIENILAEDSVEIIVELDGGERSVGIKRQLLIEKAKGKYVVFIDSDDKVSDDYLDEIFTCIVNKEPDIISFNGWMETDGTNRQNFKIRIGLPYTTISDSSGRKEFLRFPNHLCPIKKEIALKIGYADKRVFEDYDYATRLKNSGLIKTDCYIQKDLYYYLYNSKK